MPRTHESRRNNPSFYIKKAQKDLAEENPENWGYKSFGDFFKDIILSTFESVAASARAAGGTVTHMERITGDTTERAEVAIPSYQYIRDIIDNIGLPRDKARKIPQEVRDTVFAMLQRFREGEVIRDWENPEILEEYRKEVMAEARYQAASDSPPHAADVIKQLFPDKTYDEIHKGISDSFTIYGATPPITRKETFARHLSKFNPLKENEIRECGKLARLNDVDINFLLTLPKEKAKRPQKFSEAYREAIDVLEKIEGKSITASEMDRRAEMPEGRTALLLNARSLPGFDSVRKIADVFLSPNLDEETVSPEEFKKLEKAFDKMLGALPNTAEYYMAKERLFSSADEVLSMVSEDHLKDSGVGVLLKMLLAATDINLSVIEFANQGDISNPNIYPYINNPVPSPIPINPQNGEENSRAEQLIDAIDKISRSNNGEGIRPENREKFLDTAKKWHEKVTGLTAEQKKDFQNDLREQFSSKSSRSL